MTKPGHEVQVVSVENRKFLLDEKKLEYILLRKEIRDLLVMLVSMAGAFRGGKSFQLNFFLRYLTSTETARADNSWLGEDIECLAGFGWRSGNKQHTTGIVMWSEPFICTLPAGHKAGDKVAVLLMDTQGAFDNASTVNDCSVIFALSALFSSVLIYNISQLIRGDHLDHLHLFTEYGKLVSYKGNGKAFQFLKFLVRDWPFDWEHSYGYSGGESLLKEVLQINPDMPQELKDVRTHISSCFEEVTCFLMPSPGKKVNEQIEEDFIEFLKQLVTSIFSPEKLEPKVINNNIVKSQNLLTYFKYYMGEFRSGAVPPAASTVKVNIYF